MYKAEGVFNVSNMFLFYIVVRSACVESNETFTLAANYSWISQNFDITCLYSLIFQIVHVALYFTMLTI